MGCFIFPAGAMSSLARVQAILDNGITILCCTPTYAQHLGEVARERKPDMSSSRLRMIIVAGESGGSIPATRARLESLWPGASVFDHHGMTEVGPVTYQCPAQPGVLHVLENAYYPEVIDPHTRQPTAPGTPVNSCSQPWIASAHRCFVIAQAILLNPGSAASAGAVAQRPRARGWHHRTRR
jgi:phenylacetate-CoA ligase